MTRLEELLEQFNTYDKALSRIAELEAALRSVVQQCDNVIFNTAGGADNDRHLAAWRNVRDFAWRNASKP